MIISQETWDGREPKRVCRECGGTEFELGLVCVLDDAGLVEPDLYEP